MTSSALTTMPLRNELASFVKPLSSGTTPAHPLVNHAMKNAELRANWAARSVINASMTAQVFAHGLDIEGWRQLWQLQAAVWQRAQELQAGWIENWTNWLHYAAQVKGANTMTKLLEREGNISVQFGQLLSNQATDLMGLQENVEIDYAFWVNQKLNEMRRQKGSASSGA